MNKLLSLILCIAIVFSMMTFITVEAADTPAYYLVYRDMNDTVGKYEATGTWKESSKSITILDIAETVTIKPVYSNTAGSIATFTLYDIPAGDYVVQYYLPVNTSTAATVPLTLTYESTTNEYPAFDHNNTIGWHTVDLASISATADVSLAVTSNGGTTSEYVRAVAMRLIPYVEPEVSSTYIIRNTAVTGTDASNGTFELNGTWSTSSSNAFSVAGEAGVKQVVTSTAGSYAQFNFINPVAAISPVNVVEPAQYVGLADGYYDVYFYQPQQYSENDTAVEFSVYHDGEIASYTMDTAAQVAGWHMISSADAPLQFAGDGTEYIRIASTTAGKYTRVGAVKLVQNTTYDPGETPADKDPITEIKYEGGALTLVKNGSTLAEDTTVYAVVASYTDSGKLLAGIKTTAVEIVKDATDETVPIALPAVDGTSYKLFVLDSLLNIKPLVSRYDFVK
ncbi:MAG: hypothetical protein PHE51_03250 [Eubacteriales bacterium]|nr:hypothetical protein [Eubacteriales bacterium]